MSRLVLLYVLLLFRLIDCQLAPSSAQSTVNAESAASIESAASEATLASLTSYGSNQVATWGEGGYNNVTGPGTTPPPPQGTGGGGPNGSIESGPVIPVITTAVREKLFAKNVPQTAVSISGRTISNRYTFPRKQGIDDTRYLAARRLTGSNAAGRAQRWNSYRNVLWPGVHKYNLFWTEVEDSAVMPASTPLNCPGGYLQVPANVSELATAGYNRYHCYRYSSIFDLESFFFFDNAHQIETVVVVFGTPRRFINPACRGVTRNGALTKDVCVPTPEHEADFQDFITFLTFGRNARWSAANAAATGRVTHFIIGNEVASSVWFDNSPTVDVQRKITPGDARVWVTKYARLLRLAHDSIARNLAGLPAMLYVSLDRIWSNAPICPGPNWRGHCPLGGEQFLTLLWEIVGTSFDWSLAVHPYGSPLDSAWDLRVPYQAFTVQDLQFVINFQLQKLRAAGAGARANLAPQAMLALSEQHWNANGDQTITAAYYTCVFHHIALTNPNILWVTHLDFQAISADDPEGYLQLASGDLFNSPTAGSDQLLQAYKATDVNNWLINRDNYCCQNTGFGCPASPIPPPLPRKPLRVPRPHAQCRDATIAVSANCAATAKQVLAAVNDGSFDDSGLDTQVSVVPTVPLLPGRHRIVLTIRNPYQFDACTSTVTVIDDQGIYPTSVSLCGGGPNTTITGPNLPVGYTITYFKQNGCPVTASVVTVPQCTPPTSSVAEQRAGRSCLRGMVTNSANLVTMWQLSTHPYTITWQVRASSGVPAAYTTANRVLTVTCAVQVA